MDILQKHPEAETASDETLSFQKTVRTRRSFRGFLPTPVPDQVLREVLEDAQNAPSNCNTQPWHTHIVRGAKLSELSDALHAKNDAGAFTPDFSFDMEEYFEPYRARQKAQGKAYYEAMNVMRADAAGRHRPPA